MPAEVSIIFGHRGLRDLHVAVAYRDDDLQRAQFMKYAICSILAAVSLAGCSVTPSATVMSRDTGQTGTGTIENVMFGNAGPMTVNFGGQTYSGQWTAIRDSGSMSFGLLSAYGLGGASFGTASGVSQSDSGYGTALLSSSTGERMRCEYRYSLVTLTALGICETGSGEVLDLQVG
jgi:hypothetical protein